MKPNFKVTSNGNDITSVISDRLLSLSIKDEAGIKSDTCSLALDDRGQNLALPSQGTELEISIGYDSLTSMGKYKVDEIKVSYPPATVSITGKAMPSTFKEKKTRSWDDKTIGEIVSQIAGEHNLGQRVASEFQGVKIEHKDQTEESDAHFLTRLAKEHGAVAKPAGNILIFIPQGEGKSASGSSLSAVVVNVEECISYSCTIKERGNYSKVVAKYQDKETGLEKTVETSISGGDYPEHRIKELHPTQEEATSAAASVAKELKTGKVEISLSIVGRPEIFAERPITLNGFRSDPTTGTQYTIHSVTHTLSGAGYLTNVTCSNKQ